MTTVSFAPAGKRRFAPYGRALAFRQIFFAALALVFAASGAAGGRPLRIVALGDSLTAGHGLPADKAFPAVLQNALKAKGVDVEIVNAGVSGDTSADLLARLDWALGDGADAAIVEIGANDMLRGLDPEQTRKDIDEILAKLRARKIPFLIAGMRAAPNFGGRYAAEFEPIYMALAQKYQAPLYPFFLEGVAGHPDLQLPDGMHPNPKGVDVIVAGVLPPVVAWLDSLPKK
ncbi:arylesterase [Rhodoblastus acidophilus]|uniref:Arylesterase n=1 Tax=Candidatus Rhodoblastus alkanivorans TaxID=2954117 RepID=A0ABS9Z120_9HYPH|nr:arylesterase [Candidatus Rhodoblastus alkanivorans]MCI4678557.1 arylesterase [Candidatus Rhodoblastus alkanivorans]MCI4681355.1 arylesterase [Candidatus Rhodoblastus alkanivorans]MDI4642403.1 arylesterase [Rhodoblastus acidophilus]